MRASAILLLCCILASHGWAATATWSPSVGATGYRLYWGQASRSYEQMVETGPATSAVISGLTGGQTYYFGAKAFNSAGESEYSNEAVFTMPSEPPIDTEPPEVWITSPADGATVLRKSRVPVMMTADDDTGVVQVELYINGILACVDRLAPWSCPWQVPAARGKRYVLEAIAEDAAGHVAGSPPVTVTAK